MVSRGNGDRLEDIASAIAAIGSHPSTGPASDDLVLDAVAMRLGQLGEAVKGLSPRHDIVQRTINERLPGLDAAVARMSYRIASPDPATGSSVSTGRVCAGQALQAHHCFDIWSGALQPLVSSRRGRRLT